MLLHNDPLFRIYFGNADDQLFEHTFQDFSADKNLLAIDPFAKLQKVMGLQSLFFLQQAHGSNGYVINQENLQAIRPFKTEGDFLITNVPRLGIGVMTADCLPIICYDKRNNVVGIAHAGWKGSVQGIAVKMIERMQQEFSTELDQLKIFFGPSAKVCCYQVAQDFAKHFEQYPFADQLFQRHAYALFFDLPKFNRLQLEAIGVKKEAFHCDYNICTMCDEKFFSHRVQALRAADQLSIPGAQGQLDGRQMTVVCLK